MWNIRTTLIMAMLFVPFLAGTSVAKQLFNNPEFSIKAGPEFSIIVGQDSLPYSQPNAGFSAGMEVDYVPQIIGFQTGMLYVQKGTGTSYGRNYNLDYLVIPLMIRINMKEPDAKVKPHFLLGTEAGILLSADTTRDGISTDIKEQFNTFDPGLRVGFGVDVSHFTFQIHFSMSMSSISKDPDVFADNLTWGALVGGVF